MDCGSMFTYICKGKWIGVNYIDVVSSPQYTTRVFDRSYCQARDTLLIHCSLLVFPVVMNVSFCFFCFLISIQ